MDTKALLYSGYIINSQIAHLFNIKVFNQRIDGLFFKEKEQ